MVIEAVLNPIYELLGVLISALPVIGDLPTWIDNAFTLLSYILMFFPSEVFSVIFFNVITWLGIHFAWSVIEWLYKKIPGIN